MQIGSPISNAVYGIGQGMQRMNGASNAIARQGVGLQGGDVSQSLVELKVAEVEVKANVRALDRANSMLGSLLDLRA
jgi:hypothetical protein